MESSQHYPHVTRFGDFEVDLRAGELRRAGRKIKLQQQPFRVLALLLQHPGQVVTREELRQAIWPTTAFGSFDEGLDAAIYKLRNALGDSAENPRFVETLSRRGYRFIAALDDEVEHPWPDPARQAASIQQRPPMWVGGLAVIVVLLVMAMGGQAIHLRSLRRAADTHTPSIAVHPRANRPGDSMQADFAIRLSEPIVTRLGDRSREGSASSIDQLVAMHNNQELREIGHELNVSTVVVGRIQTTASGVWVKMQLVDVFSDRHLSFETYRHDLSDALALVGLRQRREIRP